MMIDLPYVQARKDGFRYRRKVKPELRHVLDKTEIILPLGKQDAGFLKRYAKAHAEAERQLAAAANPTPFQAPVMLTALEQFKWAEQRVRDLVTVDDPSHREIVAEGIASGYPVDHEGHPVGMSSHDVALVRSLMLGRKAMPEPTLEDAKRVYLKEKVRDTPDEKKKEQRVERVIGHVHAALGRETIPLRGGVSKADAFDVRDHMLDAIKSPATVKRYLNDLRAIFNFGLEHFELGKTVSNPFLKLPVKMQTVAKDERHPFSKGQLELTRKRILGSAGEDLQLIWRMLELTGCRLAEVAGLLVSDVVLDGDFPHIDLSFHPHRRLKTEGSIRKVPLVGDALDAARAAVAKAGDGPFLFAPYHDRRGADAASAALMKHVRFCVEDRKVTVHSLRHNMRDWLLQAGVEEGIRDMITGHSHGKQSERYGGPQARLEVATKAMRAALG